MKTTTKADPNEIIISSRKHHLTFYKEDITPAYADHLWSIVTTSIEGGLGGDSWGWKANTKEQIKAYNEASDKAKTEEGKNAYIDLYVDFAMWDEENDITDYIRVNAEWLHNKMIKFVNDDTQPLHLRVHFAEFLLGRDYPSSGDAVTDDALFQYAFLGEIRFG
jgi:hypothetical protein